MLRMFFISLLLLLNPPASLQDSICYSYSLFSEHLRNICGILITPLWCWSVYFERFSCWCSVENFGMLARLRIMNNKRPDLKLDTLSLSSAKAIIIYWNGDHIFCTTLTIMSWQALKYTSKISWTGATQTLLVFTKNSKIIETCDRDGSSWAAHYIDKTISKQTSSHLTKGGGCEVWSWDNQTLTIVSTKKESKPHSYRQLNTIKKGT